MKIGVVVKLDDNNIDARFKQVKDYGFDCCQLIGWKFELFTDEIAEMVNAACEKYGVTISTFWCGWSGPRVWDFMEGPVTLGLVPMDYRNERIKDLKKGSDFAKKIGVKNVATHVGFLPECPNTMEYHSLVCAIREVAQYCKDNEQNFLFETGQETPVTLLRTIQDIGLDNVGINLDPANLILYGKANPVDALDVFGKYVMDVHAKDGIYPVDGKELGEEKKIGDGKVNFEKLIPRLKEVGYDKTLIIEREISGDQQIVDIKNAKVFLEELI